MRKIILNLAVSLDGFIEGPKGEFDWCFTDQDYGMTDFLKGIDDIFFGRKSYEVLIRADKNPYPDKAKFVFSENPDYIPKNAISLKIDPVKINEIKEIMISGFLGVQTYSTNFWIWNLWMSFSYQYIHFYWETVPVYLLKGIKKLLLTWLKQDPTHRDLFNCFIGKRV